MENPLNQKILPQTLSFEEKIDLIRKSDMGVPQKIVINLAVANNELELNIAGNFFYVYSSVNDADNIQVRFNKRNQPQHTFQAQQGFRTPFHTLFITNTAQVGGEVTIVYGNLSTEFLDVIDNRAQSSAILTGILAQLQGIVTVGAENQIAMGAGATIIVAANAARRSVFIQHDPAGVGTVALGFSNAVTAVNCFVVLAPGESWTCDDYRGDIYGLRSGAATNCNYGEV
jgi:hypothetical protein